MTQHLMAGVRDTQLDVDLDYCWLGNQSRLCIMDRADTSNRWLESDEFRALDRCR
jgi:hypothetical protein